MSLSNRFENLLRREGFYFVFTVKVDMVSTFSPVKYGGDPRALVFWNLLNVSKVSKSSIGVFLLLFLFVRIQSLKNNMQNCSHITCLKTKQFLYYFSSSTFTHMLFTFSVNYSIAFVVTSL